MLFLDVKRAPSTGASSLLFFVDHQRLIQGTSRLEHIAFSAHPSIKPPSFPSDEVFGKDTRESCIGR